MLDDETLNKLYRLQATVRSMRHCVWRRGNLTCYATPIPNKFEILKNGVPWVDLIVKDEK